MEIQDISIPITAKPFDSKIKTLTLCTDKGYEFNLIIKTESENSFSLSAIIQNRKFFNIFKLNELKNKNKYFLLLDNSDEIFNEIILKLESQKPKIKENENNLEILIETGHSKFKEIIFILNEKEKTIEDKIIELYNKMNEMKIIIDNQSDKINFLENENANLKKRLSLLEQIKNCESLILNENLNYETILKNWINPNKKIKFTLLYRMTKDGDNINTYHEKCCNKGPTISLIKLEDANIIGGYTPLNFNKSGDWQKDNDSFIFSLTKNKKFGKTKMNCESIFDSEKYACNFETFKFNEKSQMSMKNMYFTGDNKYYIIGNNILDKEGYIINETQEVDILKVDFY